jgi:hypothetical protein
MMKNTSLAFFNRGATPVETEAVNLDSNLKVAA